jgi:hypothetical protein
MPGYVADEEPVNAFVVFRWRPGGESFIFDIDAVQGRDIIEVRGLRKEGARD